MAWHNVKFIRLCDRCDVIKRRGKSLGTHVLIHPPLKPRALGPILRSGHYRSLSKSTDALQHLQGFHNRKKLYQKLNTRPWLKFGRTYCRKFLRNLFWRGIVLRQALFLGRNYFLEGLFFERPFFRRAFSREALLAGVFFLGRANFREDLFLGIRLKTGERKRIVLCELIIWRKGASF